MNTSGLTGRQGLRNSQGSGEPRRGSGSSRPPKMSIDCTQPSVQNFVYMCFMFVFKRFVFAPTHIKIGIYMSALIVLSVMRDFRDGGANAHAHSTNYLAQKHNIFNQYFVKLGWAWTLTALVPFVTMTSLVYTSFNPALMKNHLARIIVATVFWYMLTNSFDLIDSFTGQCSVADARSKSECKGKRHEWINGFDISGHTFIPIYSLLIMVEEVRIFNEWVRFRQQFDVSRLQIFDNDMNSKSIIISSSLRTI